MSLERFKADFIEQLRKNPQLRPPRLETRALTVRRLHRYKDMLRAYDAARLELKLATPAQIQRENSACGPAVRSRILHFSRHG